MNNINTLKSLIETKFSDVQESVCLERGEVSFEVSAERVFETCRTLRDDAELAFDTFIDICAVDYLDYGHSEWETDDVTREGFSRGCERAEDKLTVKSWEKPRFAVVYHLLSLEKNWRVRLKVFLEETHLIIKSVCDIWPGANWFEREAYDLFGILFEGHPDLRRILTDYGFVGHPFRKDFPISGHVEMRYDAKQGRVVYEPVKIEPRILVPRVIRDDHRYTEPQLPEVKEAADA